MPCATQARSSGADPQRPAHPHSQQGECHAKERPAGERLAVGEERNHQVRMGQQLVVDGATDVGTELLVEVLLQLEGTLPLILILWVER